MSSVIVSRIISSAQAIERLIAGESLRDTWITGLLDLNPLVVSRWICGEDLRGIYRPIVIQRCILDGLNVEGRTFYEGVELVNCRITVARFKQAYFYSSLLIEDCVFQESFEGQGIQSDGPIAIRNTVFSGYANFSGINLRNKVSLRDVSFPGGTNLLHELTDGSRGQLGRKITLDGCRFCVADVPAELEAARLGIAPLSECDPGGAEG